MAYAMWELTQGVPIWLKKFLLGPVVEEKCIKSRFSRFMFISSSCACTRVENDRYYNSRVVLLFFKR